MKPAPFEYHNPVTLAEAARLLSDLGDDAKVLAGGQSLIPMLALRLTSFEHLVDLGRVEELRGVERRNGELRVAACTTHSAVGASAEIAASVPLLTRATPYIGHFQIRNRGTLGGSIAHADSAAEYPAVALALDATLELVSSYGRRMVAAEDFFTGLWGTALEPDEILASVTFPVWSGRCGFGVEEFARRHGDFALAGAVVAVELDAADRVARCAIGLIGLGSKPERAQAAEQAAVGVAATDLDVKEIGRLATADLESVPADLHGSSAYRTQLGAVMVARALRSAIQEALDA